MREKEIVTRIKVYESVEELPAEIGRLMAQAVTSRKMAYAPYSEFQVGAALLTASGRVVLGNNQENASYPSGLCAERVAFFHYGAVYADDPIRALCITAASLRFLVSRPIPPCGACRQSMVEYEFRQKQPIAIYFMGETGEVYHCESLAGILPLIFTSEELLGNS